MTKTAFERITGLSVQEVACAGNPKKKFTSRTYTAYDGRLAVASLTTSEHPGNALKMLTDRIYKIRGDRVRTEQNYLCFCCARLAPLEIDHVQMRSHGRDDRRENLRAMGVDCHRRRHAEPTWVPMPHEKIVKLMAKAGLRWGGEAVGWVKSEA